jgi:hypothetical protein
MVQGPLGFLLFWVVALCAGVLLVLLATGARFGWLLLAAVPLALLGVLALRGPRSSARRKVPEQRDIER